MKEKLLKLLEENCPDIDFMSSDKLLTDKIIDSITTVEIISAILEEFGVEIPYEEYTEENFNSVDAMVSLIEKYK